MTDNRQEPRIAVVIGVLMLLMMGVFAHAEVFNSASVEVAAEKSAPVTRVDWDDCDSHFWYGEAWGSGVGLYAPSLSWGNYHGEDCLRCEWTQSDAGVGFIRTDWVFPDENWESPVMGFKADVYVESLENLTDIILEPKAHDFNTTIESLSVTNLTTDTWHTCTWSFTNSADYSQVAGVVFMIDNLGNAPASVYFDNLRLITTTGDEVWDNMDDCSYNWAYPDGTDAEKWSSDEFWSWGVEPVTHIRASTTTPAGSVYMKWNAANSVTTEAKVESKDLSNVDWSAYHSVGADIYCTSSNAGIFVGFWDGDGWIGTVQKKVTSPNTWETIVWDIPSGTFEWSSVNVLIFHVATDEESNGKIWIDNIHFLE